jgi:hypothetical protein
MHGIISQQPHMGISADDVAYKTRLKDPSVWLFSFSSRH